MFGKDYIIDYQDGEISVLKDIIKRLEKKIRELNLTLNPIYCPMCGSCGEEGCCGKDRCLYPQDKPETIRELDRCRAKLDGRKNTIKRLLKHRCCLIGKRRLV